LRKPDCLFYQEKEKLEAPGLVWVDTATNLACEMP